MILPSLFYNSPPHPTAGWGEVHMIFSCQLLLNRCTELASSEEKDKK